MNNYFSPQFFSNCACSNSFQNTKLSHHLSRLMITSLQNTLKTGKILKHFTNQTSPFYASLRQQITLWQRLATYYNEKSGHKILKITHGKYNIHRLKFPAIQKATIFFSCKSHTAFLVFATLANLPPLNFLRTRHLFWI